MKWIVVTLPSVLVIGGALALLVTVGPLSIFTSGIQAHLGGTTAQAHSGRATAQAHSGRTTAQGTPFGDEVEALGLDQFPQIFAGATLNADGSVTIYCTQVTPALKTAVANADTDGTTYTFVIVPHSISTMDQTALAIANDYHTLATDGVALNYWAPDPVSGEVNVHLSRPSASNMQELATALGVPASSITLTTYLRAVQTLLQRQFGGLVTVNSNYLPPEEPFSSTANP